MKKTTQQQQDFSILVHRLHSMRRDAQKKIETYAAHVANVERDSALFRKYAPLIEGQKREIYTFDRVLATIKGLGYEIAPPEGVETL